MIHTYIGIAALLVGIVLAVIGFFFRKQGMDRPQWIRSLIFLAILLSHKAVEGYEYALFGI